VDQVESISADPHCQSSGVGQGSLDNYSQAVDHVDGHQQFQNPDQMELVHQSENHHCGHLMDRAEPVREAQNVEEVDSDHCDSSVDRVELFHHSQNVDQIITAHQSQYVDRAPEVDAHDQSRNVDQYADDVEPVLPSSTPVYHTAPVDSPEHIKSASSSVSIIQLSSIVGLAVVSVAAIVYILRRGRHSKA